MKMNCMGLLAISVSVFVIYVSSLAGGVDANCFTSASECKNYAKRLRPKVNVNGCGKYAFSGNYGTKGCYVYSRYRPGAYRNCAFFGTGGSKKQMNSYPGWGKQRFPTRCR